MNTLEIPHTEICFSGLTLLWVMTTVVWYIHSNELEGSAASSLKMGMAESCDMLVHVYHTWCHIGEGHNHAHYHNSLMSHLALNLPQKIISITDISFKYDFIRQYLRFDNIDLQDPGLLGCYAV